jgi:hypothetical protein
VQKVSTVTVDLAKLDARIADLDTVLATVGGRAPDPTARANAFRAWPWRQNS